MGNSTAAMPRLIVGIGASAGGLAAFKSFLAHTPADIGVGFVLVQHLAPDYKSMLVELLDAQSPLSVVTAADGMAVTENCVFVIPPDATLTIKDGILRLKTPAPPRAVRRPIDTFLTSLAEDCGDRAVGIVLSGVGSDGAIGIRAIKEHGGLTLAEAEFDHHAKSGMPSSAVATGSVDHVLEVGDMPARIVEHLRHMVEVSLATDVDGRRNDVLQHLPAITALLHARSDHDFSGYKEATLTRRIQRRMQVLQITAASEYLARLGSDPRESGELFCELLIGVTQFFRDPGAFEAFGATALLPLLAAKPADEPIRIWIPGCSTGEEVYSIAILLKETLLSIGRNPDVKIFGTDIDASAVAIARSARYRQAASGLSPERFATWFFKDGEHYCPIPAIRDMCIFSTHSVVKDPPFSRLDMISCRNVMIYLDDTLQDRLMRVFHYALVPGGFLFLGTAESVTRNSRLFAAVDKKHRILQRRDAGAAALPSFPAISLTQPQAALPPQRRHASDERVDRAVGRVLQHYAPAYFVIDHNYEITRFSGAETRHYLEPTQGTASLNLFSILHKSLRSAVRAAVTKALADGTRVINDKLSLRIDGKASALVLIAEPIGGEAGLRSTGGCVVAFRQSTGESADATDDAVPAGDAAPLALERELASMRAQLQASVDELESRVVDMKSTSEEFQAVNEELQSSNEELETAKEEMQSVNEELQTINSELNNKNDQLTRLNSDVQNLLESTQIATVFLDSELRVKHFTPMLTQLFPIREIDKGRSLTNFVTGLDYTDLAADVSSVLRDDTIVERDLQLKDDQRTFVMRIRPYRTVVGAVEGVVITFVDITERKRSEAVIISSESRLRLAQEAGGVGLFERTIETGVTTWTARLEALHGLAPGAFAGTQAAWEALVYAEDRSRTLSAVEQAIATGEPMECEWRVVWPDGSLHWLAGRFQCLKSDAGKPLTLTGVNIDITARKEAEAVQSLLTHELQHRTQNLLGVIQSIVNRTLTNERTLDDAKNVLTNRLFALARSNALLMAGKWEGAPIRSVIESALEPFAKRYEIDGPDVTLNSLATQGFSLIIHELCTNAHKYGAFSRVAGHVTIKWTIDAKDPRSMFSFTWQEHGGPPVDPPTRKSFGMTLLQQAIGGHAPAEFEYRPEGLIYRLTVPLALITSAAAST